MAELDLLDQTDEDIARQVQSGKIELFGVLMNRYEKKMLRYAGRILFNSDDAKDAVQEIFTKAYINIKSFDITRKFSSWLYRVAHNEIINIYKKNKKRSFLPLFDLDIFFPQYAKNSSHEIESNIEQQEMKKMVDQYINQLEEKYREPITLYYLEEFSYQEIADIMKLPISTVGIRIKRAKEMLKAQRHGK